MGLFDNLTGMVAGALGQGGEEGQPQGAQNIVSSLLQQGGGAGQSGGIVNSLLSSFGGQAGGAEGAAAGAGGGMAGVLETLAANGLSDHVASWLGSGQNLPVSPDQIRSALGSDQVQQMAASTGLPVGDFLKHLADHLPAAADQASNPQT